MPPSYLTLKKDEAKPDKRSTQEQFREDVLKLADKSQEASMKKRSANVRLNAWSTQCQQHRPQKLAPRPDHFLAIHSLGTTNQR